MTESLTPGIKEKLDNHTRLVLVDISRKTSQTQKYYPSRTELLLEEICASFGTELGQAFINPYNGTRLVRLSKPVVVTHRTTGEKSLIAMRHTRFSPFCWDTGKVVEVYKDNTPGSTRKSSERVTEEIIKRVEERDGSKWNTFETVTDPDYIPNVTVARWRKELYFAVFNLGGNQDEPDPDQLKPFHIHEVGLENQRVPDVYLTFSIQPVFVRRMVEKPTEGDSLHITFPQMYRRHQLAAQSALSLHPVNKIRANDNYSRNVALYSSTYPGGASYSFDTDTPRNLTMGFIHSYLRRMTIGTTL